MMINKDVSVREACMDDLCGLLELYGHLHINNSKVPSQDELDNVWGEICSNPRIHCILAEMDERLVSSCILTIVPNLTRSARPFGLIENVVTHPDFRRQGCAKTVLNHALNLARSFNCYKVMLLSNKKNDEAHHLYEKMGFDKDRKYGFVIYW